MELSPKQQTNLAILVQLFFTFFDKRPAFIAVFQPLRLSERMRRAFIYVQFSMLAPADWLARHAEERINLFSIFHKFKVTFTQSKSSKVASSGQLSTYLISLFPSVRVSKKNSTSIWRLTFCD